MKLVALLALLVVVFSVLLAGCMSEPDYSTPEEKRNVSYPTGTRFELYDCGSSAYCWEEFSKDYLCYNYPDWEQYSKIKGCARRLEGNCTYDSDCGATEFCEGGLCWKINYLELPKNVSLGTNASQEEPPIMLSCEKDSDCPGWQYLTYRCKDIFKYGKVCVATRSGALGTTPGCTNDWARDLLNGGCIPEDGEFCVNGQPYITTCPSTDWCAYSTHCVRKR